ncbi:hypothetical protein HOE04_02275 [archaeon]|mgnify:CR=1 FL=1|jgi:hypothetical protein|nr:hypothetical protein [archaeon]
MKIIGYNLIKISIERKEDLQGELKIDQNIDIQDIQKETVPISAESAIKIKFRFTIDYSNDSAKLAFEGFLVVLPDKEELNKFLDAWKNKQLPEDHKIPLFNFIMSKCNVKALALEDDLALPTHIQMPRISPQQETKN